MKSRPTRAPGGVERANSSTILGRLRYINDADGLTSFTYDGTGPNEIGRLVQTTGPSGHSLTHRYEPPTSSGNRGFLASSTYSIGGEALTMSFQYDQDGRLRRADYPEGAGQSFGVLYDYDNHGNVIALRNAANEVAFWRMMGSHQGHRIQNEHFGNGIETVRAYEAHTGRLNLVVSRASGSGDPLQALGYRYNLDGTVRERTDAALQALGEPSVERFVYDAMDRLTERLVSHAGSTEPEFIESTAYDPIGNITSRTGVGSYTYGIPGKPHALSSTDAGEYTYDNAGNLQTRRGDAVPAGFQQFTYTPFNLPKAVQTGEGPEARLTELEYDAEQQRVLKRDGSSTTLYFHDAYQRRTDESGTVEHVYRLYAGGREVAQVQRTDQAGTVSSRTLYFHDDALGSVNAITDETGTRLHLERYEPFGKAERRASDATNVRTAFTGHEEDRDLGLVNMVGRMYDPTTARFTTPDPYVQAPLWSQSHNRYSYAFNNPLGWVDPSGFQSEAVPLHDSGQAATDDDGDGLRDVYVIGERPDAFEAQKEFGGHNDFSGSMDGPPGENFDTGVTVTIGDFAPSGETTQRAAVAETLGAQYFMIDSAAGSFPTRAGYVVSPRVNIGHMIPGVNFLQTVSNPNATKNDIALAMATDVITVATVGFGAVVARAGGGLVHLTTPANALSITSSGVLRGAGGIYAGPASNAAARGLGITARTGLLPSQAGAAVRIPRSAAGAFSKPVPIGPISAWQRMTGQQFTAAGNLNLTTGVFTRTGVNYNQAFFYGVDAVFTGGAVGIGATYVFGD